MGYLPHWVVKIHKIVNTKHLTLLFTLAGRPQFQLLGMGVGGWGGCCFRVQGSGLDCDVPFCPSEASFSGSFSPVLGLGRLVSK